MSIFIPWLELPTSAKALKSIFFGSKLFQTYFYVVLELFEANERLGVGPERFAVGGNTHQGMKKHVLDLKN